MFEDMVCSAPLSGLTPRLRKVPHLPVFVLVFTTFRVGIVFFANVSNLTVVVTLFVPTIVLHVHRSGAPFRNAGVVHPLLALLLLPLTPYRPALILFSVVTRVSSAAPAKL